MNTQTDLTIVEHPPATGAARTAIGARTTAVALTGALLLLAASETVLGDLDVADDLSALRAGTTALTTAGVLQLIGVALLALVLVGIAPLVQSALTGRIGWWLLVCAVAAGGAFAMFHLVLVEVAADGLDAAAMQQFLTERIQGFGPWAVPVLVFSFLCPLGILLLLVALTRLRRAPLAAPLVFGAGVVADSVMEGGAMEIVALWLMFLGATLGAVGLWRSAPAV